MIQSLAEVRKIHLIWICRDALYYGMEFGLYAYSLIFYPGQRELILRRKLPPNVIVLRGRPNLDELIPGLIAAVRNRVVPDVSPYEVEVVHDPDELETGESLRHQFYNEMQNVLMAYSVDEVFNAALRRSRAQDRVVIFDGLCSFMESVFVGKFSVAQLGQLFDIVNTDGSEAISFDEFAAFMKEM